MGGLSVQCTGCFRLGSVGVDRSRFQAGSAAESTPGSRGRDLSHTVRRMFPGRLVGGVDHAEFWARNPSAYGRRGKAASLLSGAFQRRANNGPEWLFLTVRRLAMVALPWRFPPSSRRLNIGTPHPGGSRSSISRSAATQRLINSRNTRTRPRGDRRWSKTASSPSKGP